jgi:hypothetical protein
LLPYLEKGPKEHIAVQPQKRPRQIDQETSLSKQGRGFIDSQISSATSFRSCLKTISLEDSISQNYKQTGVQGIPIAEGPPQGTREGLYPDSLITAFMERLVQTHVLGALVISVSE